MADEGHKHKPSWNNVNHTVITDHMVLIGFGLAVIYWLLDSFLSLFLEYDNFLEKMLGVELGNIWGRLIVLCLFAIFGSHAQFTMNERKKAAQKMERDAATREKFRRLLSPDLAEMVVNGQLTVQQGGESRVTTVMFTDIRGFTSLSSNAEASSVLQMLNDYYEVVVEIVFRHEGTVDKFMGDGMMVLWGAPVTHQDDCARAVRAALDIQRAMETFNFDRASRGQLPIEVGIGINTGPVVAGYLGSSRTMSYSVIGDAVNLAARLCAAARPSEIVLSEYTQFLIQNEFLTKPRDPVHAKGKSQPLKAFTVSGIRNAQAHSHPLPTSDRPAALLKEEGI
ncbi:MAG: adenylate/guanylate cyclase domain-containing protein [Desulfobacterales bacterium]|nr:adenylate/guanylate cyclase domain-containing protein [Desulfobacterales bacterium]